MIVLQKVREFAVRWHGSQEYGVCLPYAVHLMMAEQAFRRHIGRDDSTQYDPDLILNSIWLHDVLEDTPCTLDRIELEFGARIALTVSLVTNKPGVNRKARHEATYPAIGSNVNAIIVKLCDRVANVQFSYENYDDNKIKMYKKEHPYFYSMLGQARAVAGDMTDLECRLWWKLEDYLNP